MTVDDDDAAAAALVSNTGQTGGPITNLGTPRAQPFTTGGRADGYTLTRVDVVASADSNPWNSSETVRIEAESGGKPSGTSLGALTTAGGTGTVTFSTSSGIDLAPGTTYFAILSSSRSSHTGLAYSRTASDNEDSGAAAGWTIGDGSLWGGGWNSSSDTSLRMAVHGYAEIDADAGEQRRADRTAATRPSTATTARRSPPAATRTATP